MIIPNYVPGPLEVDGNVGAARYRDRLRFLRTVVHGNTVFTALILAASYLPWPDMGVRTSVFFWLAVVIGLDLFRIFKREQSIEAKVSAWMLPLLGLSLSWVLHEIIARGGFVWPLFVAIAFQSGYALVCGRDFSFVGFFFLPWIASLFALGLFGVAGKVSSEGMSLSIWACSGWLFYTAYDLSMIMRRRRLGEELAAILDIHRDFLNVFGYIPRVIAHWKKHHIWVEVKGEINRSFDGR